ncbi:hypothetical protein [Haloferax larsenii]|uniref:hypothetical protein n=1 Tax=Haloferax larsenii TaxID=302484 RepID=UPI00111359FD|nr:hypothetical protein [Haloferax larsenii]
MPDERLPPSPRLFSQFVWGFTRCSTSSKCRTLHLTDGATRRRGDWVNVRRMVALTRDVIPYGSSNYVVVTSD